MSDYPNYQCASYNLQLEDLLVVRDCYVGTKAVRAKGKSYLPQFPAEDNGSYNSRLSQSVFFNAFKRTIQGLTGLVFRKNPILGDDIDDELKAQLENVDNQGTHIDVFAKNVFEAGVRDGHTFIYVDMPESVVNDNQNATLADEQNAALRPYWVHYLKDQIINWQTAEVNGQIILTQVTIWERKVIADGLYGEKVVDQYRVLTPGEFVVYEVRDNKKKKAEVEEVGRGTTSLDFIPLVAFYSDKQDYFDSCPPLLDLANENLRHYRLRSDLDNIMHVCNVPILTAIGRADPRQALTISNSVVDVPVGGDLKYTEHSGAAISAAQAELDKSQATMAALGLMLLSEQPKQQMTATESGFRNQAELSTLSGMARSLQDSLEMAFIFHASYLNKSPGSIKINQKFGLGGMSADKVSAYTKMVNDKQLTIDTLWQMLLEAEELNDTFDADVEKKALGISLIQAQAIKALTDSGASIKSAAMAAGVGEELASLLQITDEPTGVVQ